MWNTLLLIGEGVPGKRFMQTQIQSRLFGTIRDPDPTAKETLENQANPRNGDLIADQDWIDGRQGDRVSCRPATRPTARAALDCGLLDLIEAAKVRIRAKGEHSFRVINQRFGFQKTRLRGMAGNRYKGRVIAALTNLFWAPQALLETL